MRLRTVSIVKDVIKYPQHGAETREFPELVDGLGDNEIGYFVVEELPDGAYRHWNNIEFYDAYNAMIHAMQINRQPAKVKKYLTQEEKSRIMEFWDRIKRDGSPDVGMVPICELINANTEFCTTSSCSGHYGAGHRPKTGHVYLRATEAGAKLFDDAALSLARHANITAIKKWFERDGRIVFSIEFIGEADGCLSQSLAILEGFFLQLRDMSE